MADSDHKPGDARARGETIARILASDAQLAPAPLTTEAYRFLGDTDLPASRYTCQAFFQQELSKMWSRCWQWACREEHLPEVGDHYVYDIGPYSVIVTRVANDEIKAFINSCTHRGTRLLGDEGVGHGQGFNCPFHGWSWHLNGVLKDVPGRWDFPHVCEASHSLQPVACESWQGFVFINLDPDASPLQRTARCPPRPLRALPTRSTPHSPARAKVLPANWKAAQEAFMEAYHNFTTHDSPTGGNAQYDIFGPHASRFHTHDRSLLTRIARRLPGRQMARPPTHRTGTIGGYTGYPTHLGRQVKPPARSGAQLLREEMGSQLGVDFSAVSDSEMLDSIEYHLFPNAFFFPGELISMAYRFRPLGDDVDSCLFEILDARASRQRAPPTPIPPSRCVLRRRPVLHRGRGAGLVGRGLRSGHEQSAPATAGPQGVA